MHTAYTRRSLSAIIALSSALALELAGTTKQADASAQYCHTDSDGRLACIHQVLGPRNYRGLIFTIDGYYYQARYNCYDYNYHPSSIRSVACWAYDPAQDTGESSNTNIKQASPAILKSLAETGTPSPNNTLTPEEIRSKIPPEMR